MTRKEVKIIFLFKLVIFTGEINTIAQEHHYHFLKTFLFESRSEQHALFVSFLFLDVAATVVSAGGKSR